MGKILFLGVGKRGVEDGEDIFVFDRDKFKEMLKLGGFEGLERGV